MYHLARGRLLSVCAFCTVKRAGLRKQEALKSGSSDDTTQSIESSTETLVGFIAGMSLIIRLPTTVSDERSTFKVT